MWFNSARESAGMVVARGRKVGRSNVQLTADYPTIGMALDIIRRGAQQRSEPPPLFVCRALSSLTAGRGGTRAPAPCAPGFVDGRILISVGARKLRIAAATRNYPVMCNPHLTSNCPRFILYNRCLNRISTSL